MVLYNSEFDWAPDGAVSQFAFGLVVMEIGAPDGTGVVWLSSKVMIEFYAPDGVVWLVENWFTMFVIGNIMW